MYSDDSDQEKENHSIVLPKRKKPSNDSDDSDQEKENRPIVLSEQKKLSSDKEEDIISDIEEIKYQKKRGRLLRK
jgi:hypothetical protein